MKSKFLIFIIFLIFDYIGSSLFLKKTIYWKNYNWEKKYWRISSDVYHHDLLPNIDVTEKWGDVLTTNLKTNSIGFIDKSNRKIEKESNKKRILLIGDSFIEGIGLEHKNTFAGLLDEYLGNNYEVLNSAVSSYSPSIYYAKTKYLIEKGYKFNQALIFLDISDIFDELFNDLDSEGNLIVKSQITLSKNSFKQKFYKFGYFLRDNFITFRIFQLISDKTEQSKNYLKLKYKASKEMNKSFFSTSKTDVLFYRMTHIDRGFWTYNDKKYLEIKKGLEQSDLSLKYLFQLLNKNNIESALIIYPWPTQILYGDKYHQKYWENFSKENNIYFINLYNKFNSKDKRNFILQNFITGDVHWNKKGTKKIFEEIINKIQF